MLYLEERGGLISITMRDAIKTKLVMAMVLVPATVDTDRASLSNFTNPNSTNQWNYLRASFRGQGGAVGQRGHSQFLE